MNNKILLIIGAILLVLGLVRPNINLPINNKPVDNPIVIITPPSDNDVKELCKPIIESLKNGSSSREKDAQRLSDLYLDLSTLVELDGDNEVIKTTEEIRQANSLTGVMLRLNIKGAYPGLGEASQALLSSQLGDDMVTLDSTLRNKAVDTFRALAWACNEGSK
jgi:hypothetical protein